DASADLRAGDPVVGANELERLAPCHRIRLELRRLVLGQAAQPAGRTRRNAGGHLLEEIRDRNIQHASQIEEAARPNPVGAALVLLHLLKGQANRLPELLLTHPEQGAAEPQAAADMNVDRIGVAHAGHATGWLSSTRHDLLNSLLQWGF